MDRKRGVSLPELLVVIAILALAMMISVPLVARRVHDAKVRASISQYTLSLRAARMIAVTRQTPVTVTVQPDPVNRYAYTDATGRPRTVEMPPGVRIRSDSTGAIQFRPNGSLAAVATTHIEATLSGDEIELVTIETNLSGIPSVSP